METKALKKQLGAAIAMVVVAAIALGSATYAWFATNNKVEANTSTISAKSNAAFLTISKETTGNTGTAKDIYATVATKDTDNKALYPANFTVATDTSSANKWQTGYSASMSEATLSGNLVDCAATNQDAGTTAAATAGDFILVQDYTVSSRNFDQTNLKVDGVAVKTSSNSNLNSALRIMVTCGDVTSSTDNASWVIYGLDANSNGYVIKESSSKASDGTYKSPVLASTIEAENNTLVHVYLYYDGDDTKVTTNNLLSTTDSEKLSATNNVTVTFSATPGNK